MPVAVWLLVAALLYVLFRAALAEGRLHIGSALAFAQSPVALIALRWAVRRVYGRWESAPPSHKRLIRGTELLIVFAGGYTLGIGATLLRLVGP